MKAKLALALALGFLMCALGCSSSGPSAKVKEFINLAGKSDVEGMLNLMPKGTGQAEARQKNTAFLRGEGDLLFNAATEGVKSIEIVKENENERAATVDASVTFTGQEQGVVYRFELQKEGKEWKVSKWERITNSR